MAIESGLGEASFPRNIPAGETQWQGTRIANWTVGFWPGILWYLYETDGDDYWLQKATYFTNQLEPIRDLNFNTHDLGFMAYLSFGHGYRITEDPDYRQILLGSADKLAELYNPDTGTLLAWPWMLDIRGWPNHMVITSIMNLNILFWAAKNGRPDYYDMAVNHADASLRYLIRDDFSTWQVVHFDSITQRPSQRLTFHGLHDESTWARGHAFAIYGFNVAYAETGEQRFLDAATGLAQMFINRLPEDFIPYWDFDVELEEEKLKDASAASIAASALLELSQLIDNNNKQTLFFESGVRILQSLSGKAYKARNVNHAFLLHSVGIMRENSEVNSSTIYADYYYLEALIRYKNILMAS